MKEEKKVKMSSKYKARIPLKEKLKKYLYKQLVAVIFSIIVLIINPVNDIYYYGSSIISLLIVIISFKDLVEERNELVTHPLPQLEKRGGDENE